jgi:hypothetical protein
LGLVITLRFGNTNLALVIIRGPWQNESTTKNTSKLKFDVIRTPQQVEQWNRLTRSVLNQEQATSQHNQTFYFAYPNTSTTKSNSFQTNPTRSQEIFNPQLPRARPFLTWTIWLQDSSTAERQCALGYLTPNNNLLLTIQTLFSEELHRQTIHHTIPWTLYPTSRLWKCKRELHATYART